jgi:hypothetical protein
MESPDARRLAMTAALPAAHGGGRGSGPHWRSLIELVAGRPLGGRERSWPSGPRPAKVHLINVGYRCLSFDSSKQVLLQKVIANPAFGPAARQAVVSQLNCLAFDSTRQVILNDVNQRQSRP